MLRDDVKEILISEEQLKEMVARLGREITEEYKDKNLLMIGILKGCVVFMSDLMRAVDLKCRIDFMAVSSYGSGTQSSGNVRIVKDLDINLEGYDVLLIEDILDSGNTLSYVRSLLATRGAKSAVPQIFRPILSVPRSRINSSLDTALILMKSIAIYSLWVFRTPMFTAVNDRSDRF